jgi:hypothetical protein
LQRKILKIIQKKRVKRISKAENISFSSAEATNSFLLSRKKKFDTNNEEDSNITAYDEISSDFEFDWSFPSSHETNLIFSSVSGINTSQKELFSCVKPKDFYLLLATEEIFQIIADQTNLFASQKLTDIQSYRTDQWYNTNPEEIKRFFGLIIWMGIVNLPTIESYWSKEDGYNLDLPRKTMPRNRFEILLRFLHFSDNTKNDPNNRLSKLKIL